MSLGGSLELLRQWNSIALESEDITPDASAAAVVVWTEPDNVDDGPSPVLKDWLATGFSRLGEVAFPFRNPAPPDLRVLGRIGRQWRKPPLAVASRSPEEIALLFEYGWALGRQVAFIGGDDERALDMVGAINWRTDRLNSGEIAIGAIVDGNGMIVAASTEAELERALQAVLAPALQGGYRLIL